MSSPMRTELSALSASPAVEPCVPTTSTMSTAAGAPASAIQAPAVPPAAPPSVHVRAVITWMAIFPLVSAGMLLLGPAMESWHPVLRSLLLTAIVVPLAVYVVVPRMLGAYGKLMRRRALRAARRGL